jgi:hypothetical protein
MRTGIIFLEKRINFAETLQNASEFDTSDESKNETPTETLVHGFINSLCIHNLQDNIVEIAPAEGQHPLRNI